MSELSAGANVILIWSSDTDNRVAVTLEWSAGLIDAGVRVIPVTLDSTPLPHILSTIVRIDLINVTNEAAEARVLDGIFGRSRPIDELPFPRTSGHDPKKVSQVDTPLRSLDSRLATRSDADSFSNSARNRKSLWLAAKGFDVFLHQYEATVTAALRTGSEFRFLMNNPENEVLMQMMSKLSYGNRPEHIVRERLTHAVERILTLSSAYEGQVELRVTDWLIPTGYTFYDPESPDAALYVEFFGYRVSLGDRLALHCTRRAEPRFFDMHLANYKRQWGNAHSYQEGQ